MGWLIDGLVEVGLSKRMPADQSSLLISNQLYVLPLNPAANQFHPGFTLEIFEFDTTQAESVSQGSLKGEHDVSVASAWQLLQKRHIPELQRHHVYIYINTYICNLVILYIYIKNAVC